MRHWLKGPNQLLIVPDVRQAEESPLHHTGVLRTMTNEVRLTLNKYIDSNRLCFKHKKSAFVPRAELTQM